MRITTLIQGIFKRITRQSRPCSLTIRSLHFLIRIALALAALWAFSKGTAAQDTSQFLTPPYYGTQQVTSVFDHEYPNYSEEEPAGIMHYDGTESTTLYYSGHNGIDYPLRYEPVRAAAPGHVIEASWDDPQDHRAGYGLQVRIDHGNHDNGMRA